MKITADIVVTRVQTWPLSDMPAGDLKDEIMKAGLKEIKVYHGLLASQDTKGRFRKGEPIRTSYVVKEKGDLIYTRNSVYRKVSEA